MEAVLYHQANMLLSAAYIYLVSLVTTWDVNKPTARLPKSHSSGFGFTRLFCPRTEHFIPLCRFIAFLSNFRLLCKGSSRSREREERSAIKIFAQNLGPTDQDS